MSIASLIGKSRHVEQLRKLIARLRATRRDAVIIGESGVGKSAAAALIADGETLRTFNLIDQSEQELESVLLGTCGGIVLFENLEEAGFRVQDCVLRFLEHRPRPVRVLLTLRLATRELLLQRKLTENLCARINEMEKVEIRPLRERPEDIPLLVKHFAGGLVIDINTLDTLVNLRWERNIYELKSVIEKCLSTTSDGKFVLPSELVDERTEVAKMVGGLMEGQRSVLDKSLDMIENTIIRRTLERFGFDESKAAKFLGMNEHIFGQKVIRLATAKHDPR